MSDTGEEQAASSSTSLGALGRRALGTTIFGLGAAGCVFVGITIVRSTGEDSDVVPFGGWQPNLVGAGLAFLALLLLVLGVIGIRRLRPPRGASVTFQVLLTVAALALGTLLAGLGDAGGEHALTWASNHTSAAHHAHAEEQALLHRALGDATHPPVLPNFGEPASQQEAAPMLRPSDLGKLWHYTGAPAVTAGRPTPTPGYPTAIQRVRTYLVAEQWDGHQWNTDENLIESVTTYSSHAAALRAIHSDTHTSLACTPVAPCQPVAQYAKSHTGNVRTWRETGQRSGSAQALALRGSTVVHLVVFRLRGSAAPLLTPDQFLRAAIHRLTLAG
jgi:hypothetical protein